MPVKELTAKRDRCGDSLVCPAVFEDTGTGRLIIVGTQAEQQAVDGRVGQDEVALEISRGLVTRAIAGPISGLLMRFGL